MSRPKLTLIRGGLAPENRKKTFISAYATDTRLMGGMVVHAKWQNDFVGAEDDGVITHQFFYLNCDDQEIDTYKCVSERDVHEIESTEQALVGGLGAEKIDITLDELTAIISHYARAHESKGVPLPKKSAEFGNLVIPDFELSAGASSRLMKRICGRINSNYQIINYFLMRAVANDYNGMKFLANYDSILPFDAFSDYRKATFCRNEIDPKRIYVDEAHEYVCESLIECVGEHYRVVSRIVVRHDKVIDFEICSTVHISTTEAAMILTKPEFMTVMDVLLSDEDIEANISEFTLGFKTIMTPHKNGRLFMAFKDNNEHVNEKVYVLSNDVHGLYYLTNYGQLIVVAYNIYDIKNLENKLLSSPLAPYLEITGKFQFRESILFEFIKGDFEDFFDFLEFLQGLE